MSTLNLEKYKLSRYNIVANSEKLGVIAFNTRTGALNILEDIRLADTFTRANERDDPTCLAIVSEYVETLIQEGYLIERGIDEMDLLFTRSLVGRTAREIILSIMLTLRCNFRCWYCFEPHPLVDMSESVEKSILAYISKNAGKTDAIRTDWYGGEPLIRWKQLQRMNTEIARIADATGVPYFTAITTNGYLLTPVKLDYFAKFNVEQFQITLDGGPITHNRSRILSDGRPTFNRILQNMADTVERGMHVSLRVNMHREMLDIDILALYDILDARGLKNRVSIILRPALSGQVNPCEERVMGMQEFATAMMRISNIAARKGWIVFPPANTIQASSFCVVDCTGQFIIDPWGNLYKCGEQFTPEERVGKILEDGTAEIDMPRWSSWVGKNPLHFAECRECQWLPLCQGGCSMKRKWTTHAPCIEEKFSPDQYVETLALSEMNRNS